MTSHTKSIDKINGFVTAGLADWLTDWQTNRLTGLTDRQTEWVTDWLTDWLTDRMTDRINHWLTDRLTEWLTDWMPCTPRPPSAIWQDGRTGRSAKRPCKMAGRQDGRTGRSAKRPGACMQYDEPGHECERSTLTTGRWIPEDWLRTLADIVPTARGLWRRYTRYVQ